MIKKLRFFIWLVQAFVARHRQTLIIATLASFFFILFIWRYSDFVQNYFFNDKKIIGVTGRYTPSTLPRFIQKKISVGLTQISDKQIIAPAVANSWEIKDKGKTFLFNTRTDLFWHDGKPFSANDINYNFEDASITAINPQLLKISLKDAFSPLPSLLTKPLFRQGLIGLGPLVVSNIVQNGQYIEKIELKPLDPTSDKPEIIKFYPTLNEAITAFKLGEINTLQTEEEPKQLLAWEDRIDITKEESTSHYVSILFRTDKPPFDKKLFRQALAYSIPDSVSKTGIKSPVSENSWAYNETIKKINFNEEKALDFFEKSGVATVSAEFSIYAFQNLFDVANQIKEAWEKTLKIKPRIKVANTIPDDFSVIIMIEEIPVDPDQYFLWHSTQQSTNITKFINPKIDKLLEDGRKTFDLEKRKEIYDEFQRYLMDELPAIFLYHPEIYTISRK